MSATAPTNTRKTAAPKKVTAKKLVEKKVSAESELTVEQLIAKMEKALPGWKKYTEDRKAGKAKDQRRNAKEYAEFERGYTALRAKGLKLAEARKHIAS